MKALGFNSLKARPFRAIGFKISTCAPLRAGDDRRAEMASLQSDVKNTAAEFADGKAEAAPLSTYMFPAQMKKDEGEGGEVRRCRLTPPSG